jgi:predicted ATP-grasp superfamily ATP-dependent carboligase
MPDSRKAAPPAVVVGLCSHGLATVRSLRDAGVSVHALEADGGLPGAKTRLAEVHLAKQVNGPGVVQALEELRPRIESDLSPVLYLMNDNMVREIGTQWERLQDSYRLSWAGCRERVVKLLAKSALQEHCERVGLTYPRSSVLEGADQIDRLEVSPDSPLMVKPVKPLSKFKTRQARTADELRSLCDEFRTELPFLVQPWVSGGDRSLFFCAMYLDDGAVRAAFTGQKIRSNPPAMGQTTMAWPYPDSSTIQELTEQFFRPLALSGPVSLEFKRDAAGVYWVIEPTIGRTDFWLRCCTANGVDFPQIEYCHTTGRELPHAEQTSRQVWMDTERDPAALAWYLLSPQGILATRKRIAFPYLRFDDLRPFFAAVRSNALELLRRLARRIARVGRLRS